MAKYFKSPLKLKRGADEIEKEISKYETVFVISKINVKSKLNRIYRRFIQSVICCLI